MSGGHGGARPSRSLNQLEKLGWVNTRAGRWIDPETKLSYPAREAWEKIHDAGHIEPLPDESEDDLAELAEEI